MTFDPRTRLAQRIYSNMPDAYPVSGTKPANPTEWSRLVLEEKKTFVANDIDGIARVFDDHELIRSLGCESVMNVPIIVAGEVIGTINCLHEAVLYPGEGSGRRGAQAARRAVPAPIQQRNSRSGDRLMAEQNLRVANGRRRHLHATSALRFAPNPLPGGNMFAQLPTGNPSDTYAGIYE